MLIYYLFNSILYHSISIVNISVHAIVLLKNQTTSIKSNLVSPSFLIIYLLVRRTRSAAIITATTTT